MVPNHVDYFLLGGLTNYYEILSRYRFAQFVFSTGPYLALTPYGTIYDYVLWASH